MKIQNTLNAPVYGGKINDLIKLYNFSPVPDKFNGDVLAKLKTSLYNIPYGFIIDYLILNLKGAPLVNSENPDFKYIKADYGTKQFKERGQIYFREILIGQIMFSPRSSVLKKDDVQMKIENSLFYTLPPNELKKLLLDLLYLLGLEFSSVSRLDLAIDFLHGSHHPIIEVIKNLASGKYRVSGRKKKIDFYSETKKGVLEFEGVRIGKRSSARFARIYNKTKENTENAKLYIREFWKKIGLSGEIWRYEFQLNNRYLREIKDFGFMQLFDMEYLFSLFQMAETSYFTIKENTGKKEVNKEKSIFWIDLNHVRKNLKYNFSDVVRLKRTINETLIGQQRMLKGLLRSYCASFQDSDYISTLKRICLDFDLLEWFKKKLPLYLEEFERKQIILVWENEQFENDLSFAL